MSENEKAISKIKVKKPGEADVDYNIKDVEGRDLIENLENQFIIAAQEQEINIIDNLITEINAIKELEETATTAYEAINSLVPRWQICRGDE